MKRSLLSSHLLNAMCDVTVRFSDLLQLKRLFPTAAFLAAVVAAPAQATLVYDARVSVYDITFSDLTFANANARYDVHVDVSGSDGDSLTGTSISVRTDQTNFTWTSGTNDTTSESFLMVSNVTNPGNTGSASADIALSGGNSGAFDFGYDAASWVTRGTGPSEYTLNFQGGGSGVLSAGGLFSVVIFVQGDWTSHGVGPGQLEFLGINSGWNTNFTFDNYDSNLNRTIFSASAISDGSAGFGPNVGFRLHGDAIPATVPEPGMIPLLLAGVFAFRFHARRCVRRASDRRLDANAPDKLV